LQRQNFPSTSVRDAANKGNYKGLFVEQVVKSGVVVIEYNGEHINEKTLHRRLQTHRVNGDMCYFMQ
jgi:hypothetical protein